MSLLPPGIARDHRLALASARRLRAQAYRLFLAAFRTDGIDRELANGLHQRAVSICEDLERLPRRASLATQAEGGR